MPRKIKRTVHRNAPPRDLLARYRVALSNTLSINRPLADCAPQECDRREAQLRDVMAALRAGTCTQDQMYHMIDATNIAGFRLDTGDFSEADLIICAGKAATESLHETFVANGRYIAHAHELNNLDAFTEHYITMMRASTPKEWNTAQQKLVAAYERVERETA